MPKTRQLRAPDNDRDRFDDHIARYFDLFARADQRAWFRLYVRGLLTAPDRKNVEAIAAASARVKQGANLGQALQHFVSQSPWDHEQVLARYRRLLPDRFREGGSVWVVVDGTLLKKGRNSVGTQRQFARSVGRKVNCQLAVVVGLDGDAGFVPLAGRLYLPAYWLREYPDLADRTVPADHRTHVSKSTIALGFLDRLRDEGWVAGTVAADEGYTTSEDFRHSLAQRGLGAVADPTTPLTSAAERFDWLKSRLGLDHFEGRTWTGWHHHFTMVLVAAGYLLSQSGEQS